MVKYFLLRMQRFLFLIIHFLRFGKIKNKKKKLQDIWKTSAVGSTKPLVPLICLGLWGGGSQDRRKRYHHVLAVTRKYIKVKRIGPKILTTVQMACVGETWECFMRNHTKLRCYRNKTQNRKRGKCITDSARHARQHFINIRWKK